MQPEAVNDLRRTWVAMQKFAHDEFLTDQEWEDSQLADVNRSQSP